MPRDLVSVIEDAYLAGYELAEDEMKEVAEHPGNKPFSPLALVRHARAYARHVLGLPTETDKPKEAADAPPAEG